MGCHYHVYVGPYLDIPTQTKTVTKTKVCCINNECSQFHKEFKAQFCPACGTKLHSVEYEEKVQENFDLYGYCEKNFNNGDQFSMLYDMVVGNFKEDLIEFTENEFEIDLENIKNTKPYSKNWKKLLEFLDRDKIDYEYHFGVMGFWY
jgi:hypothetical protein